MRIAYCIHSLHNAGGMERVLTLKANALSEIPGYEVHIITAALRGRKPCFPLAEAVRLHDLDIHEHLYPRRFARLLEEKLREISPDITVSLAGSELRFLPGMKDGSVKIAEFHFTHDKYYFKYGRTLYARMRTQRLEKAAAGMECFVVLTREDKIRWEQVMDHVVQIYNPITFSKIERSTLDSKRCIAVGRLAKEKNFRELIEAWQEVAAKHPDWTLEIFGDGPERKKLERLIASCSLEGKVLLRGRSSEIRREMLGASCLVMSSRFEGFPMVLLEAASTGLPMVSYACPSGPSEIIRDGENGYLVPPGDVAALSGAILSVIEHPDKRTLGKASAETAVSFTPDRIIPKWDDLFKSLVK